MIYNTSTILNNLILFAGFILQSVTPVIRSDLEPRPRLEDDGDWLSSSSQRKPWLPTDFNQDIRPFDDLFSNSLDTYADARTGAGLSIAGNTVLVIMVSLYLLLLGA